MRTRVLFWSCLLTAWVFTAWAASLDAQPTASSTASGTTASGAVDGERFSLDAGSLWRGEVGNETWWWQIWFDQPRPVGAILQVNGDHSTVFQNAPRRYVWQWSEDARVWHDLEDTETHRERRLFRIHRLSSARDVRGLRILVSESAGDAPTLREVEFYDGPRAAIEVGAWIVSVSTRESAALPGGTGAFVSLARQCPGWESVLAQQIWIGDFDGEFVAAEPYPLCAFLTGNSKEWCQRTREPWRGVQEVLAARNLPIWGACEWRIATFTPPSSTWSCPVRLRTREGSWATSLHWPRSGAATTPRGSQCLVQSRSRSEAGADTLGLAAKRPDRLQPSSLPNLKRVQLDFSHVESQPHGSADEPG